MIELLAEFGGTNTRCAILKDRGAPQRVAVLANRDFADPAAALEHYLREIAAPAVPKAGRFAAAAIVAGDRISLTNHPWTFSASAMRRRLGLARLSVVNDFEAAALGVPALGARHLRRVGGGKAAANAPKLVLGPGTGLGLCGLVPAGEGGSGGWRTLGCEGGHVTLAAANEREAEILARLRGQFGHVSAERAVSGPGLVNLFRAVAESAGVAPPTATPEGIVRRAVDGSSQFCREALALFFALLGTFASNAALTVGARGGVYIAGGMAAPLAPLFASSPFRARFEDKGRYSAFLAAIPTFVVTHSHPGLLGLALLEPPRGKKSPARRR